MEVSMSAVLLLSPQGSTLHCLVPFFSQLPSFLPICHCPAPVSHRLSPPHCKGVLTALLFPAHSGCHRRVMTPKAPLMVALFPCPTQPKLSTPINARVVRGSGLPGTVLIYICCHSIAINGASCILKSSNLGDKNDTFILLITI